MKKYPTKNQQKLIKAFSQLKTEREIKNFLRDLLTPAEIEEFSKRFQIAQLLWNTNLSYVQIAQKVGASTATVTRVAFWLFKENWQGYASVLKRIYGKSQR